MLKFNLPEELDDIKIQSFIDSKNNPQKTILNGNSNFIKKRIMRYQKYKNVFHIVPVIKSADNLHEALLSCYSSKTKLLKQYLSDIRELAPEEFKNRCPYCGINEPKTVDHILPKAIFPEYSFMPLNLIYVCSTCNSDKLDNYISGKNRLFINPYIDEFLNIEFTKLNLEVDEIENPHIKYDFILNLNNISNNRNKETITSHFEKLNLLERITNRISGSISQTYKKILNEFSKGNSVEEIKETFREETELNEKMYGTNHYKTASSRAFANSDYIDKLYNYLTR